MLSYSMDDPEIVTLRQAALANLTRPFVVAAVIGAYFAAPAIRFIDPFSLYVGGGLLAMGAGLATAGFALVDLKHFVKTTVAGLVLCSISLTGLVFLAIPAQKVSIHIDQQCQILEHDMMRTHPARSDSRELFTALGCRAQGVGTIIFPSGKGWVRQGDMFLLTKE